MDLTKILRMGWLIFFSKSIGITMNLSIEQIHPYSTYIYFKCIQSKGKYSFQIVKTPQCTVRRQTLRIKHS
jgi:hypothetical protein